MPQGRLFMLNLRERWGRLVAKTIHFKNIRSYCFEDVYYLVGLAFVASSIYHSHRWVNTVLYRCATYFLYLKCFCF